MFSASANSNSKEDREAITRLASGICSVKARILRLLQGGVDSVLNEIRRSLPPYLSPEQKHW